MMDLKALGFNAANEMQSRRLTSIRDFEDYLELFEAGARAMNDAILERCHGYRTIQVQDLRDLLREEGKEEL